MILKKGSLMKKQGNFGENVIFSSNFISKVEKIKNLNSYKTYVNTSTDR